MSVTPLTVTNLISNQLTITGSGFQLGAAAKLGNVALNQVTVVSSTRLTAWTPVGIPAGVYTLTVTNPDALSAALANAVTVKTPLQIVSVTPLTVTNLISNQLTITGSGFQLGAAAKLGNVALNQVTVVSSTRLTAWTPVGIPAGVYTLTVTNPDALSAALQPTPSPSRLPCRLYR